MPDCCRRSSGVESCNAIIIREQAHFYICYYSHDQSSGHVNFAIELPIVLENPTGKTVTQPRGARFSNSFELTARWVMGPSSIFDVGGEKESWNWKNTDDERRADERTVRRGACAAQQEKGAKTMAHQIVNWYPGSKHKAQNSVGGNKFAALFLRFGKLYPAASQALFRTMTFLGKHSCESHM